MIYFGGGGGGGGGGERLKNVKIVLEEKATCRRYRMTNQNRFWKESDHWARDKKWSLPLKMSLSTFRWWLSTKTTCKIMMATTLWISSTVQLISSINGLFCDIRYLIRDRSSLKFYSDGQDMNRLRIKYLVGFEDFLFLWQLHFYTVKPCKNVRNLYNYIVPISV
jgi:hypothetical protein